MHRARRLVWQGASAAFLRWFRPRYLSVEEKSPVRHIPPLLRYRWIFTGSEREDSDQSREVE